MRNFDCRGRGSRKAMRPPAAIQGKPLRRLTERSLLTSTSQRSSDGRPGERARDSVRLPVHSITESPDR